MCDFQGTYGAERCALQALQHLILHHSRHAQNPQVIPLPAGVSMKTAQDHASNHLMRLRAIRADLEDLFGQEPSEKQSAHERIAALWEGAEEL